MSAQNDSAFSPSQARAKRARRKTFAPFSIGEQAVLFVCLTILLLFVDLFLYIGITVYENNQAFGNGSPKSVTMKIGEDLVRNEAGDYELSAYAQSWMDEEQCWAILISNEGTVDWSRNAPESVVHPYTLADAATFARMGYLDDYPCFICKRDDGILVAGFPKDSYARCFPELLAAADHAAHPSSTSCSSSSWTRESCSWRISYRADASKRTSNPW